MGFSRVTYKVYDYSGFNYYYSYNYLIIPTKSLKTTNMPLEIKVFLVPQGKFVIGITLFLILVINNDNDDVLYNFNGVMIGFLL
jgi:hypothetical protein